MSCAKGLRHKNVKNCQMASSKISLFPDLLQIPRFSGLASRSFVQRSLNGYYLLLEKTAPSACSRLLSQLSWR